MWLCIPMANRPFLLYLTDYMLYSVADYSCLLLQMPHYSPWPSAHLPERTFVLPLLMDPQLTV